MAMRSSLLFPCLGLLYGVTNKIFLIVAGCLLAGASIAVAHMSFLALLQFINGYRARFYGIYSLRTYAPSVIYPAVGVILSFTAGLAVGFTNPVVILSCAANGSLLTVMYAFLLFSFLTGHI